MSTVDASLKATNAWDAWHKIVRYEGGYRVSLGAAAPIRGGLQPCSARGMRNRVPRAAACTAVRLLMLDSIPFVLLCAHRTLP